MMAKTIKHTFSAVLNQSAFNISLGRICNKNGSAALAISRDPRMTVIGMRMLKRNFADDFAALNFSILFSLNKEKTVTPNRAARIPAATGMYLEKSVNISVSASAKRKPIFKATKPTAIPTIVKKIFIIALGKIVSTLIEVM